MLRWTRTENGIYRAGTFRVYAVDGGGWALTQDGKPMGKFRTASEAKERAVRWLASR